MSHLHNSYELAKKAFYCFIFFMFHILQAFEKKTKRGVIVISQMTVIKLGKIDPPYVPPPFASNQKT